MSDVPPKKGKSRFRSKINNLSEAERRGLFKLLMVAVSITIIIVWIPALKVSIEKILNQPRNPIFNDAEITEMKQNFDQVINQAQGVINNLRQDETANTATTTPSTSPTSTAALQPTSSPNLSDEELEILKEKIREKLN